jgi:hypothetical protein
MLECNRIKCQKKFEIGDSFVEIVPVILTDEDITEQLDYWIKNVWKDTTSNS